jgi:hypothetical protein
MRRRDEIARNAPSTAFTQPIRMTPYAWTAPKVQMSARLPPHRAAMGGRLSDCSSVERTILVFVLVY